MNRLRVLSCLLVCLVWFVALPAFALELRGIPSNPDFFSVTVRGQADRAVSLAGQASFFFDTDDNTLKLSQNTGAYAALIASGGNAPADAQYWVGAAHAGLSA